MTEPNEPRDELDDSQDTIPEEIEPEPEVLNMTQFYNNINMQSLMSKNQHLDRFKKKYTIEGATRTRLNANSTYEVLKTMAIKKPMAAQKPQIAAAPKPPNLFNRKKSLKGYNHSFYDIRRKSKVETSEIIISSSKRDKCSIITYR